mgnify:CR=1 FL=1
MSKATLLALLLPLAASAEVSRHSIQTVPAQPRPGEPFQIKVTGSWPNTCPLQMLPVTINGADIEVSVRQGDVICGDAVTPFVLVFDPAAVGGSGFPADRDYRVHFSARDAAGNRTLLALKVVDVGRVDARAAQPEAGFWTLDQAGEFQPGGSGIGFMIERQGNTLALTTNTYELNGQPTWYLSAGPFTGSVFQGDLLRSVGGQPLFGTYRGPQFVETVGTVQIEFLSDAQATLWFTQAADAGVLAPLEVTTISAQRMNFALPTEGRALAGTWTLTPTTILSGSQSQLVRLVYAADRSGPNEAVLVDTNAGYELRCSLDPQRRDGPPRLCILSSGGAEIGRFDNNALTRLSGKRSNESVVMVRVAD